MLKEITGPGGHCLVYIRDVDTLDTPDPEFGAFLVATEHCLGPVMVSTTLGIGNTEVVWHYCGECVAKAKSRRDVLVEDLPLYQSWYHEDLYDHLLAYGDPPLAPTPEHKTSPLEPPEVLMEPGGAQAEPPIDPKE
jgi:hypothetical protein